MTKLDSLRIDSLIKVIEKAVKVVPIAEKAEIQALFIMFNLSCLCIAIFLGWCFVRFPGMRDAFGKMVRNDDGKYEHRDGDKVIIWGASLGFFWLCVNTIISSLNYGPDTAWYIVIGLEITALGALLGINLKKIKARS